MSQDLISDALNQIMNAKKAGKQELEIRKHSKLLIRVLELAKKYKYLDFRVDKSLKLKIMNLEKCKAIKPRFNVAVEELEKYIKRFLPARNFGLLIISTSSGLMTQEEAYNKNMGGSLIAYFY